MLDLWYEGYGAGLSDCTWIATVAGRYLTQWERSALYAGYRTALEDKSEWPKDMQEYCYPVGDTTIPY